MKKKFGVFLFALVICCAISVEGLDTALLNYAKTTADTVIQKEQENVPTLYESMLMYQGETRLLDIDHVGGVSKVSFRSQDSSIVSVSQSGRLTAKNCGETIVWVRMRRDKKLAQARIKIVVKYSSFYSSLDAGKAISVDKNNTKAPLLYFHKQLSVGQTSLIDLRNTTKDSVLDCVVNPTDVVSISENGTVRALKTGTAVVRLTLQQNGRQYKFCEVYHVIGKTQKAQYTDEQLKNWFADAGFLGNSISVGLDNYLRSGKEPILAACPVMAKGSYSFANEASSSYQYKVTYNGTAYKADEAVRVSKVKKIFINMGANDIGYGPQKAYEQYQAYLAKIRQTNPDVRIYIQSMTPVYKPKAVGRFGMDKVNEFNRLMKAYCDSQPDLYYIDISTPMMTSDGTLRKDCCSDEFVHLTYTAYALWTDAVIDQIRTLAIQEKKAEDAVITYERGRRTADYSKALSLVKNLEKGTVRTSLMNRLSKTKARARGLMTVQAQERTHLERPVIRSVKAKNNTSLVIRWEKVAGAKFYRVYRATKKTGTYREIKLTARLNYTDTGLQKDKKYYYKIRACRAREQVSSDSILALAKGAYTKNVPEVEVFAGDSVMTGLDVYGKLGSITSPGRKYTVAHKGLGTLTFQTKNVFDNQRKTAVEQILAYKPDRLYIKLGANELSYADLSRMYRNYSDIIEQIKDESPKTQIVILSVAPVSRSVAANKTGFARISQWNEKLKELAKEQDVHYYDFTADFCDSSGYLAYNGGDGIHWSVSGYDKFCSLITEYDKKLNH